LLLIPGTLLAGQVRVGAKAFTESYILASIVVQVIDRDFSGVGAERTLETPSSMMAFNALKSGEIDVYPEYTGTLSEQLLGRPDLNTVEELRSAIKPMGLVMSDPLGFDNSYAIAVPEKVANELGIKRISDLREHPDLVAGFSYPFLRRSDGFHAMSRFYGLDMKNVRGMEHALTYSAIENGSIQVTDIYTTDAQLEKLDLRILKDDKQFFPKYFGVYLANGEFVERHPKIWKKVSSFAGSLDQGEMIRLNAMVDLEGKSIPSVARFFLSAGLKEASDRDFIRTSEFWKRTYEHLFLVAVSLLASIIVGIPLGLLATRSRTTGQIILGISGAIQTIPSLALLCFMIPLIGIGTIPALVALFLYGLLPIVRNTFTGIKSVNRNLLDIGQILGLNSRRKIVWIELPIASPSIIAGIKTSAVINVGTATLAAFIGAGGYGSFIVTGLALNDIPTILHGAVPAALLALILQGLFDVLDNVLIPKGVRLQSRK
jgi:osmoprotectant transport system permease protein